MKVRREFLLIIAIFFIFSFLFSFISIKRHNNFESQGWDLALYDQIVWLYSQGKNPYSTLTQRIDFADRFRPILVLLTPFYWLKTDVKIILILQAIFLTSGVFPIFLITKTLLKNSFAAFSISLAYVLFPGIQSFFIDDFHEVALFPPLLLWLFYFFLTKRNYLFFLSLFLCLMIREHLGFFLAFVSLYLLLISKKNKKIALSAFALSLGWSILSIWLIMPLFGEFRYKDLGAENERLEQTIIRYLNHPFQTFLLMFTPMEKIKTIILSFTSFGLFPLFYPQLFIPIFYQFFSRFLDALHPYRWTLYFHYSGEIASLMALGSIFAFKRLSFLFKNREKTIRFFSLILLCSVALTQILLPIPLKNLIKVGFYQEKNWAISNQKVIALIPPNASVATQNNLAPHLSRREKIYILPDGIGAEYIFVDLHEGQNQWNFYTLSKEKINKVVFKLLDSEEYSLVFKEGETFLLKRTEKYQDKTKEIFQLTDEQN